MSHSVAPEEYQEPNLVPLLDLVLQLVMFFMICTNFVVEQFDAKIKLPKATMAKSLEAKEGNLLYLNVNEKGHVRVLDRREELTTPNDVERYLVNKYKDELAKARREQKDAKEPTTLIIIRGHRDATCDKIYVILRSCKLAGFSRVQLRVLAEQGA